jgi:hypothetical protein
MAPDTADPMPQPDVPLRKEKDTVKGRFSVSRPRAMLQLWP